MASGRDRYDYIGRMREQRLEMEIRDRRRAAVKAVTQVSVQITRDGQSIEELLFDTPPTLAEMLEAAGADAYVLAIDRLHKTVRKGLAGPVAAE